MSWMRRRGFQPSASPLRRRGPRQTSPPPPPFPRRFPPRASERPPAPARDARPLVRPRRARKPTVRRDRGSAGGGGSGGGPAARRQLRTAATRRRALPARPEDRLACRPRAPSAKRVGAQSRERQVRTESRKRPGDGDRQDQRPQDDASPRPRGRDTGCRARANLRQAGHHRTAGAATLRTNRDAAAPRRDPGRCGAHSSSQARTREAHSPSSPRGARPASRPAARGAPRRRPARAPRRRPDAERREPTGRRTAPARRAKRPGRDGPQRRRDRRERRKRPGTSRSPARPPRWGATHPQTRRRLPRQSQSQNRPRNPKTNPARDAQTNRGKPRLNIRAKPYRTRAPLRVVRKGDESAAPRQHANGTRAIAARTAFASSPRPLILGTHPDFLCRILHRDGDFSRVFDIGDAVHLEYGASKLVHPRREREALEGLSRCALVARRLGRRRGISACLVHLASSKGVEQCPWNSSSPGPKEGGLRGAAAPTRRETCTGG